MHLDSQGAEQQEGGTTQSLVSHAGSISTRWLREQPAVKGCDAEGCSGFEGRGMGRRCYRHMRLITAPRVGVSTPSVAVLQHVMQPSAAPRRPGLSCGGYRPPKRMGAAGAPGPCGGRSRAVAPRAGGPFGTVHRVTAGAASESELRGDGPPDVSRRPYLRHGCPYGGEMKKKEGSFRQQKRAFAGTLSASQSWDLLYFKGSRLVVGGWWQLALGGPWGLSLTIRTALIPAHLARHSTGPRRRLRANDGGGRTQGQAVLYSGRCGATEGLIPRRQVGPPKARTGSKLIGQRKFLIGRRPRRKYYCLRQCTSKRG